jgi:protein-tyrosine-phosphatase
LLLYLWEIIFTNSHGNVMEIDREKIHILAVCTGNICRSPMAEGILKKALENVKDIRISSAGTHALDGNPASEFAIIAAHENGIDISGHRARSLGKRLISESSFILCMEPSHVESVISLETSVHGSAHNLADFSGKSNFKRIPDPYGSSLREYRECFADIHLCLENFISHHLLKEYPDLSSSLEEP